jgi:hypothetical protein
VFFPWEKFLPPWLLGPLLVAVGIWAMATGRNLAWWHWVLLPIAVAVGAWGTWMWFAKGENVFKTSKRSDQPDNGRSL